MEEEVQELRDEWGLDDPYLVRYGNYLKHLLVDRSLGVSYVNKKEVSTEIVARFKVSFAIAVESTIIAVLFGFGNGGTGRHTPEYLGGQCLHGCGSGGSLHAGFLDWTCTVNCLCPETWLASFQRLGERLRNPCFPAYLWR